MIDISMPLYVNHPGDRNDPDCPHERWSEREHGGIYLRFCARCARTECTLPGVDICLYEPPTVATTPLGRLFEAMNRVSCDRFTSVRCAACQLSICSDHMAAHIAEECSGRCAI